MVKRGEVWLFNPDPSQGEEIAKTRPCLVVSPDEMHLARMCIVAPMTTGGHAYAARIPCRFKSKSGHIVLDQIRAVDQSRLVKKLGIIDEVTGKRVLSVLREMFEE